MSVFASCFADRDAGSCRALSRSTLGRFVGRRRGLGAGGFATVDQSLMRGSSRMIWFVAGLPCTEHECGPKPLQDEVKGSPDLRPAPRPVRRTGRCVAGGRGRVTGQQPLALGVAAGRRRKVGGAGREQCPRPVTHLSGHRLPSLYRAASIAARPHHVPDLNTPLRPHRLRGAAGMAGPAAWATAQTKPTSSRAIAAIATVGRLPRAVRRR